MRNIIILIRERGKTKMKKLFALLMAGMMVFALCACTPEKAAENPANQEKVAPNVNEKGAKETPDVKGEKTEEKTDVEDKKVQDKTDIEDKKAEDALDVKDEKAMDKKAPAPTPTPAPAQ